MPFSANIVSLCMNRLGIFVKYISQIYLLSFLFILACPKSSESLTVVTLRLLMIVEQLK